MQFYLVLGVTAQLSDITWCIGDEVNYTCTVNSVVHTWEMGSAILAYVSSGTQQPVQIGPYTLQRVSPLDATPVITSLTVTAFAQLNNTVISCRDGVISTGGRQETTVMVFGENNDMHCYNSNLIFQEQYSVVEF